MKIARALHNTAGQPCVSLREAARMLGVSRTRVQQYVKDKRLKAETAPGGIPLMLVPIAEVKAFRRRATGRPREKKEPERCAAGGAKGR